MSKEFINWRNVFNRILLHLGHFLGRYDFAALEMMTSGIRENLRKVIRVRNMKLPEGERMSNLEEHFIVWKAYKNLLQREGRNPYDIIFTGGYVDRKAVNTVMSLDLVTKQYTTLTPMITARNSNHASVVHDGKLFVMGGYNRGNLHSVECLDLETGQWSEMAPMITPRCNHSSAVLGGKIYVAGGDPMHTVGTLVECFDPDTNQWTAVASMNTGRAVHCLVSTHNRLFAVGGFNLYDEILRSVECFDQSTGLGGAG